MNKCTNEMSIKWIWQFSAQITVSTQIHTIFPLDVGETTFIFCSFIHFAFLSQPNTEKTDHCVKWCVQHIGCLHWMPIVFAGGNSAALFINIVIHDFVYAICFFIQFFYSFLPANPLTFRQLFRCTFVHFPFIVWHSSNCKLIEQI